MKINYPLLALAIGAFGIGTTEFSPMGLTYRKLKNQTIPLSTPYAT
ncbi:hypothetical protein K7J61_001199 [Escherichia coli]|nr:hypothetical protein [Escherichia coli]MCC7989622.1 hypothetical protein [Escherichia coli]